MQPGEIYPLTVNLYPHVATFSSGAIASGWTFRAATSRDSMCNPNTGEPLNDNRQTKIAINTVYHDASRPSQLILPVVPTHAP